MQYIGMLALYKHYDENSNEGYFLEVDVKYPKHLFHLHSNLPFLPERNKIKKCNKLFCSIHDKENSCSLKNFKTRIKYGLIFKKVHKVIQFNQKEWLKPNIEMNTKLRAEAKNDFEKDFFKIMNNAVFEKTMENERKHRDIKLITTNKRRNQLASGPSITIQQNIFQKI